VKKKVTKRKRACHAVLRTSLRVDDSARACGNSPALRQAQTVRVLFSVRIVDAWRVTKGSKHNSCKVFLIPALGATEGLLVGSKAPLIFS